MRSGQSSFLGSLPSVIGHWSLVIGHSLALLLFTAAASSALDISLGSATVRPGTNATITITFSNAPANPISAFAFYLHTDAAFGAPTIATGTNQSNLSAFVDDFGNGTHRITGFVLSGPSISNGHIATLNYSVPADMLAGTYPIGFATLPSGINPEARALISSDLITGVGAGGSITVVTNTAAAALITGITPQPGQTFLLQFSGTAGFYYTVEASTNLVNWSPLTNLQAGGAGLFQFIDLDATNYPFRFYRALYP